MIEHAHHGVYGVIQQDGKILLVRKSRGPYKGKLDLPGGKIEDGEADIDCLVREVKEETGVQVISAKFLEEFEYKTTYINDKGQKENFYHNGKVYLVVEFNDHKINLNISDQDVTSAEWQSLSNVKLDQLSPFASADIELLKYSN